ncbi:MAG: stage V sporulation protein AE [Firmicutes bacterium]|nr:stage V sporulation protein AE [Alicyclobacillaceae bacterium]MCL6496708.1 stage V sporulation protein AE [Bacillota bacterium]
MIVLTDGDHTAYRAAEVACRRLGIGLVRASAGNPTPLRGQALVEAIRKTPGDPVLAMVDDRGDPARGRGERALEDILRAPELDVVGVVAVAAHTRGVAGVRPDASVTAEAETVSGAVDKEGDPAGPVLHGDTVDVLARYPSVPVVGLGDPGKMDGEDRPERGAPATTEALRALLRGKFDEEGREVGHGGAVSRPG